MTWTTVSVELEQSNPGEKDLFQGYTTKELKCGEETEGCGIKVRCLCQQ